jgi:hypothetical protein
MAIDFNEIASAYDLVSSDRDETTEAYYDTTKCKIYIQSDYIDPEDEILEDIDYDKCIPIPGKHELDLGQKLVFSFIEKFLPDELNLIEDYFRHPGAYSKFKAHLDKIGLLDNWYKFEEESQERALREWCRENKIELSS